MMPPPPDVHKLNEEASLLEEPEDESVATGREAFALLYQELASLAAEVLDGFMGFQLAGL
jgi:hypothetical protein